MSNIVYGNPKANNAIKYAFDKLDKDDKLLHTLVEDYCHLEHSVDWTDDDDSPYTIEAQSKIPSAFLARVLGAQKEKHE